MKKARRFIYYGSIAVIVATVCFLIRYYYVRAHENDVYEALQAAVSVTHTPAPTQQTAPSEPAAEPHLCPVDFAALQAETPDIYAWIEIPGMDISYPVVQNTDNDDLYLRHDIKGEYNDHGAIYSHASVNGRDFAEYHVILYGHNFEDGTMFSNLTQYRDSTVLNANRDIYVYTPQSELHYRIFAAVTFSDAYLPDSYDAASDGGRQAFLDDLPDVVRDLNNHILDDVSVTEQDKLLILSTCTGNTDRVEHRYLVVAVLEEQTPWDAAQAP